MRATEPEAQLEAQELQVLLVNPEPPEILEFLATPDPPDQCPTSLPGFPSCLSPREGKRAPVLAQILSAIFRPK